MSGQKSRLLRTVVPINVCLDAWMRGCMDAWDTGTAAAEQMRETIKKVTSSSGLGTYHMPISDQKCDDCRIRCRKYPSGAGARFDIKTPKP